MKQGFCVLFFAVIWNSAISGQVANDTSLHSFVLPHLHYGVGLPGAALADRFGLHFDLGLGASVLTKKRVFLGFGYNFLFGSDVKENVLSSLLTTEGGIIGSDMQFASIFLRERGYHAYVQAGYLFRMKNVGKASGILCTGGLGLLAHRIRFVDDFDSVVQLAEPYRRGYDRLSRGVSIHQFLGYLHLSKNRLVNFFAGLQLTQGFTTSIRGYNYDRGKSDTDRRFDLLTTMKIGWVFPISLFRENRYY